jgi:hypothetical protein
VACLKNRPFPPQATAQNQARVQENNRGRIEIRAVDLIEVTPSQVCFPGVYLAGRLLTRAWRKGQWTEKIVYLLSSYTLEQMQALGMLKLKRGYWVIESRLHHCLDISMQEDLSRVRDPNSARVLGTTRRVVLSLANAAVDAARKLNPKTKANTKSFRQRFLSARQGVQRLQALIFSKDPAILGLVK